MKLFSKKTEKKENMKTIKISRKYQKILSLITFDEKNNFSESINTLLDINEVNDEVEITITEICYLKLKNIMVEKEYKDFNEVFKNLLC